MSLLQIAMYLFLYEDASARKPGSPLVHKLLCSTLAYEGGLPLSCNMLRHELGLGTVRRDAVPIAIISRAQFLEGYGLRRSLTHDHAVPLHSTCVLAAESVCHPAYCIL